jgi:HEPN domain-containing protein
MPPKKDAFGTAQQWLQRAKGNLALAKQPKPKEAFWDDLCFDAQQAAEKSIKAVLVHRKIDFPKTHNIRALLELVDPTGSQISKEIWQAIDLTNYAVETRYPGPAEPVTRSEHRQAVALAQKVVKWAKYCLAKRRK